MPFHHENDNSPIIIQRLKGEYHETPKSRDACPDYSGKRHVVSDKFVVGIDPVKQKHQAMIPKEFLLENPFLLKVLTTVSFLSYGKNYMICLLNLFSHLEGAL